MEDYKDTKGRDSKLNQHVLTRLKLIVSWAAEWVQNNEGEMITKASIYGLTNREFNKWRSKISLLQKNQFHQNPRQLSSGHLD